MNKEQAEKIRKDYIAEGRAVIKKHEKFEFPCEYYKAMDTIFNTSETSPLHHDNRHAKNICKPDSRVSMDEIWQIDSWETAQDIAHCVVFFTHPVTFNGFPANSICSCDTQLKEK